MKHYCPLWLDVQTPLLLTKEMGSPGLPLAGHAGESILHDFVMIIRGVLFVQDLLCSVGFNSTLNLPGVRCWTNPPVPLNFCGVCQTLGLEGGLQRRSERHPPLTPLITPQIWYMTTLESVQSSADSGQCCHMVLRKSVFSFIRFDFSCRLLRGSKYPKSCN